MGERILEEAVRDGQTAEGAAEDDDGFGHGWWEGDFMSDYTKIRIIVYDVFRSVCLLYVCSVSSRQGVSDVNV